MAVVINVPHHGVPVSTSATRCGCDGGVPNLADLNARADRVEQALAILIEASGRGRNPDQRGEAAAMAATQDALPPSPTQRRLQQLRATRAEIRRITQINDGHYKGAR